jgi:CheY-like chemotaxis protein
LNWLIVEDEADIRNLVVMMCQVWGNTPMPYESGQKAWDWLDSVEAGTYAGAMPDFALMDIRMPGKRGNEISARIRTIPALQKIPVVLMTAFVMSEEEMERMRQEFGVDEVINKPLPDFDQLRSVLYGIIDRKKAKNAQESASVPAPAPVTEVAPPVPEVAAVTEAPPQAEPVKDGEKTEQPTSEASPAPEEKTEASSATDVTRPARPQQPNDTESKIP